jgi:hypothetical protein
MQGPNDANLKSTFALPNGAATTNSGALRTDNSARGDFCANHELSLAAPALTTGQLADAQTMVYALQTDDNSSFSSPTTIVDRLLVQTGAGGAGAAAATRYFRLPANVEKFVRVTATKSGAGDASGASAVLKAIATGPA